jgi:hypothetical protein
MAVAWRIALFVICALLLCAHYLRQGELVLVGLCLVSPLLFLLRRRWALIVLQVLAYAAAVAWIQTTLVLVLFRRHIGEPWHKAAFILGAVALVTALTGALLNSRAIVSRYPR